ncbi:hypothetical protein BGX21_002394 [Mortierella sp. AD011]|nr:hypothetical protein BGX20_010509 [Mortierella sp. AD010]KAF9401208.1 hypothetical protein BGX21_002394 [Mortierella sp. AD011]
MYWRFGHQNASVIDHLLESNNVSLEELLEQDDLIQECKAQNPKLIEYLRDPTVLEQLLSYITSDDLEDRARFKYPFIACEIIACEVWGIYESALSNIDMLVKFWEFLDRPQPLNPVQASYFAKVIGIFLMKKTSEMLEFIKSQPEVVPKLLLHMSTSAIMDLLLKIISMEESPDGKGTVQWLSEQGLMPWLVNRLDPNFDAEVHSIASQVLLDIIAISQSSHPEQPSIGTNILIDELKSEVLVSQLVSFMLDRDAPFSSSTLINGVTIFIELIRRNNSDYDVEPLPPGSTEPIREAVDLSDLLKVLASRIEDFKNLLIVPRSVSGPIETSIGKQTPLGFERLKICEMFAELLHCSNMAVLNSRPIISVSPDGSVKIPTISFDIRDQYFSDADIEKVGSGSNTSGTLSTKPTADGAVTTNDGLTAPWTSPLLRVSTLTMASPIIASLSLTSHGQGDVMIPVGDFLKLQFVDHRIIPTCFDLFFQFPWNNFLHTVVYDMVHQVFHRPMGDIGRPDVDGTYIPPKSDQDVTEGWNRRLTISIFKDGQLTKRITDAQRLNDYECAQPKGVRLGYMGHLTYIADETVKLLELYSQTSLMSTLYEFIDLEDWWNYVSKILKETKDRDAQVLGGNRPNVIENQRSGYDDGNDDDYMDDNDDEFGNGFMGGDIGAGHEGDVASDQFARYLCQQITNNLPDKFGSSDEDEDDEEGNWIGEYGAENEFDMRHTGAVDDRFASGHALDFDSEDEEGVDEETWDAPWPSAFPEVKPMDQGSSTQLTATLTVESETLTVVSHSEEDSKSDMNAHTTNSETKPGELDKQTPADAAATNVPATIATGTDVNNIEHDETREITVHVPVPSTLGSTPEHEDSKRSTGISETEPSTVKEPKDVDPKPIALSPVAHETPTTKGTSIVKVDDVLPPSHTPLSSSSAVLDNSDSSVQSISSKVEPSTPAETSATQSSQEQQTPTVKTEAVPLVNPIEDPELLRVTEEVGKLELKHE